MWITGMSGSLGFQWLVDKKAQTSLYVLRVLLWDPSLHFCEDLLLIHLINN